MARQRRTTYNYTFRVGRKVSHRGITNNPGEGRLSIVKFGQVGN